jgi:protein TonB
VSPAPRTEREKPHQRLFEAVFGEQRPRRARARWSAHFTAWSVALGFHLVLFIAANRTEPSLETWSARIAALIHADLVAQAPVAIESPPPPTPAAEPEPEPEPAQPEPQAPPPVARPSSQRAPDKPAPPSSPVEATPPAQAASVIASEAEPEGPVDLTDNTFVTGTASAYAGGATARDGTSATRVAPQAPRATSDHAAPAAGPGSSKARTVQLPDSGFRCSWPQSAVAEDIYEQFVVLRADVRADGTAERVTIIDDPGHGFGAAAVKCALSTRFMPARNERGEPIRALSPPIRVRFTR